MTSVIQKCSTSSKYDHWHHRHLTDTPLLNALAERCWRWLFNSSREQRKRMLTSLSDSLWVAEVPHNFIHIFEIRFKLRLKVFNSFSDRQECYSWKTKCNSWRNHLSLKESELQKEFFLLQLSVNVFLTWKNPKERGTENTRKMNPDSNNRAAGFLLLPTIHLMQKPEEMQLTHYI